MDSNLTADLHWMNLEYLLASMGKLSNIFLEDDTAVVAKLVFQLCNLALGLNKFLEGCKTVKLKPNLTKTNPLSCKSDVLPTLSKVIKIWFLKNYYFPELDHPFSTHAKLSEKLRR